MYYYYYDVHSFYVIQFDAGGCVIVMQRIIHTHKRLHTWVCLGDREGVVDVRACMHKYVYILKLIYKETVKNIINMATRNNDIQSFC